MEYILSMVFLTDSGVKSTLTISGVKATITQVQVDTLMDTIIAKNIFLPNAGAFVSKSGAQLTERKITKYELV